jgi:hypothetical protein
MPSLYTMADRASLEAQRRFRRGTIAVLALVVIASLLGLVEESWAGWVSGGAFAASIAATGLVVFRDAEDNWYDGRAVAESAKTLTWKYAVGGQPFTVTDSSAASAYEDALAAVVDEIRALHGGISLPADPSPAARLQNLRREPLSTRRGVYREQRLADQRAWYYRRAGEHRGTANRWQRVALLFQAAGLACAALKGLEIVQVDLLSVCATAAAATVAWLAAGDYVKSARAYELTTLELDQALSIAHTMEQERAWAGFVADAEQTMSREHTAWFARRRGLQ